MRSAAPGRGLIVSALDSGSVAKMIAADIRFHEFLYGLSGNPLIAPSVATHLTDTQRVMGEVLQRDEQPRDIWNQHAELSSLVIGPRSTTSIRRTVVS